MKGLIIVQELSNILTNFNYLSWGWQIRETFVSFSTRSVYISRCFQHVGSYGRGNYGQACLLELVRELKDMVSLIMNYVLLIRNIP